MKKRKIYSECVNAKIARNQSGKRWQAVFVYALDAHGIKGYELKKHFFMPGGEVDKAHPFVSACVKKAGELLDRAEEPMPFGASCEQCFLVEAGAATVIIGRAVWIRRIRWMNTSKGRNCSVRQSCIARLRWIF